MCISPRTLIRRRNGLNAKLLAGTFDGPYYFRLVLVVWDYSMLVKGPMLVARVSKVALRPTGIFCLGFKLFGPLLDNWQSTTNAERDFTDLGSRAGLPTLVFHFSN